ncbi:PepSY-like domain-containing protein [Sphingobacterium mizutaii]|uniref:PepSY-like domain-containing protein n=1 Tax=Sphingobacterium mizutaii TaxID=1010 RepID=UPI003D954D25
MKNLIKTLMVLFIAGFSFQAIAQEKVIEVANLPKTAQSFLQNHYNNDKVALTKSEKETLSPIEYKVVLASGTEVEFDSKGDWTEVDANTAAVPQDIVPAKIKSYVQKSFPDNKIVQIKKDKKGYEIELTNGIEVKFNKNAEFIKIDD